MNKQEATNRKQCIMTNSRKISYHQAKTNDKLTSEQTDSFFRLQQHICPFAPSIL